MGTGLVVGIEGTRLDESVRKRLLHPAIVGVILFARNFRDADQLRELTAGLSGLKRPRPLICVDQEGGRVQRFKDGFTLLPPLAAIGRWYPQHPDRARDLAYRHGRVMAAELLGHGVDLSLAPVLDLDRGSPVIGDRSFSDDPDAVVELARHFIAGMRDAGMKNCGKHFPGHGSIPGDTHDESVDDDRNFDALERDIQPFRALAGSLDAVMPAHVRYPGVDPRPAGFSPTWIGRILRNELGFEGVVVSDDLDMNGAGEQLELQERLTAAQRAGCDLALVCGPASVPKLLEQLPADEAEYATARHAAASLRGRVPRLEAIVDQAGAVMKTERTGDKERLT
jgi:beta-N-acetylhexosaminidase